MGRTTYKYKQDNGREDVFAASEIIDSAFSVKQDGISARSPIQMGKDTIGLGLAIQRYASNFFQNGWCASIRLDRSIYNQDRLA